MTRVCAAGGAAADPLYADCEQQQWRKHELYFPLGHVQLCAGCRMTPPEVVLAKLRPTSDGVGNIDPRLTPGSIWLIYECMETEVSLVNPDGSVRDGDIVWHSAAWWKMGAFFVRSALS